MVLTRFNLRRRFRRKARPSSPTLKERSPYVVHSYTQSDRRLIASPNHLFFPSRKTSLLRYLTEPTSNHSPIEYVRGLSTQKDLLAFDIYPTCSHSLEVNSILYETVQNGNFDSAKLEKILGVHILVLGLAPELHQFLSVTSREEVDTAIVDFLVLLHHQLEIEGDTEGVLRLEEDLEPTIRARMHDGIGIFPDGEPPVGRRADVLEQIVQLAFLTPWRVDVWGAYLSRNEVRDLRFQVTTYGDATAAKIFKDWIVFSEVLQSTTPDWGIADGVERAICAGVSTEIFSKVTLVSTLAGDVKSKLHKLPRDVVDGYLIPWLVRQECEALPSKRRLVAPLEPASVGVKFLDELEAADADVISRLAIDRDGLSLWREWVSKIGTGNEREEDFCFSLDEKPWDRLDVRRRGERFEGWDFGQSSLSLSDAHGHENLSWGRSFLRNRRSLQ